MTKPAATSLKIKRRGFSSKAYCDSAHFQRYQPFIASPEDFALHALNDEDFM